ncbi:50S ribosomal protein L24 [Candidatus Epulonipiscium fishelsonii]|uniref:50S ribosomal protein L24 n=1 Tax=Candidatus Epulonipiscium fishelsonii TaxID=77094 RepID=A0ACC8XAL2_9FIRM|nr:50S ribosomal protein L24 [Epulopiscium sp. SCG-B11WGA-EpuloA1]ONI40126.1 50S ribosomal protein L24 [Epulopiscium sp. SCG-B05WGA-EpuloA1]
MKTKFKKGDKVIVIAGNNKNEKGKIMFIDHKKSRVIVEGVNMIKKHQKPNSTNQGGIIEKEGPIHISNIMYLYDEKPVRLGTQITNGKKSRVAIVKGERKLI